MQSAANGTSALAILIALGSAVHAEAAPPAYRGTLTFARGSVVGPQSSVDLDLATDRIEGRYDGWDPQRAARGEGAYIARIGAGYVADAGIVATDARGVPGAPVFVCKSYNFGSNRVCHTPKLSPDGKLIAFGMVGGNGKVCKDNYGMFWADYVVVSDRSGAEVARYEGYFLPEWLPDGRLLMMGSLCHGAGVWIADNARAQPRRIDGGQVATPAGVPAISPDGRRVAMVWNNQLWTMTLDDKHELTQITHFEQAVSAGAWSPDGTAFAVLLYDVVLPVRGVVIFRPGDQSSQIVKPLSFYPYGPLSWR